MHDELEGYLQVLKGQNKAKGTIQQYSGGLKAFSEWLEEVHLEPKAVTTGDVQQYLAWLGNEREYAPKTVRGYYSPVSSYYGNLESLGEIEEDPTEDVTLSNYASKETRKEQETKEKRIWMRKEQIEELVGNVPAPVVRNRLLVLFQYFTGLRRQEVVDVELDDIDREERSVKVRGKGGKTNTTWWKPRLDGLLTAWIDGGYRDASPYAKESEYLFLSASGPSLSADQLNKIVVQAAENAGFQEILYEDSRGYSHYKYTSHVLRHSFAMHFLQSEDTTFGGLSKLMAHSSVRTTEIYAEVLEERVKDEYDKFEAEIEF